MKKQLCAALLLAAIILVFSGCGLMAAEARRGVQEPVKTPPAVSQPSETTPTIATTPPTTPATSAAPVQILTKEDAEAIALAYVGLTKEQVSRMRTEYEIDDRIPQYEVQFHEGYWEYEFEIHAETGEILSFDKDD